MQRWKHLVIPFMAVRDMSLRDRQLRFGGMFLFSPSSHRQNSLVLQEFKQVRSFIDWVKFSSCFFIAVYLVSNYLLNFFKILFLSIWFLYQVWFSLFLLLFVFFWSFFDWFFLQFYPSLFDFIFFLCQIWSSFLNSNFLYWILFSCWISFFFKFYLPLFWLVGIWLHYFFMFALYSVIQLLEPCHGFEKFDEVVFGPF